MKAFLFALVLSACSSAAFAEAKKSEILVHAVAEVKKGMGCTQATAKTKFPMTAQECKEFLALHGMYPRIDARNPLMQIERDAIVPIGTMFAYVTTQDFTGWVLVDMD